MGKKKVNQVIDQQVKSIAILEDILVFAWSQLYLKDFQTFWFAECALRQHVLVFIFLMQTLNGLIFFFLTFLSLSCFLKVWYASKIRIRYCKYCTEVLNAVYLKAVYYIIPDIAEMWVFLIKFIFISCISNIVLSFFFLI